MQKSKRSPVPPAGNDRWWWSLFSVLLIILGYLTWAHFQQTAVWCPAGGGPVNCARVLTGPGSVVAGLPLPVWGGIWVLAGLGVYRRHPRVRAYAAVWAALGGAGILWALIHEWQDHALCIWCTVAQALILTLILVSTARLGFGEKKPFYFYRMRRFGWWSGGVWLAAVIALLIAGIPSSPAPTPVAGGDQGVVLRTLDNQPGKLPSGPLVVEVMAPWCEYCATTAKWLNHSEAAYARQKGMGFVLIDFSDMGGVGIAAQAPTLQSISQTAHDGSGVKLTSDAQIAANLKQFQNTYALSGIPIFFVPLGNALPSSWNATSYPTYIRLDGSHQPVTAHAGFLTEAQFQAWVNQSG